MPERSKSIMRALGEFFGHVARGISADPAAAERRTVVSAESTEREQTLADGQRVILRRTVVDEVVVLPDQAGVDGGQKDSAA